MSDDFEFPADTMAGRIERQLKALDLNPTAASKEATGKPDAIRKIYDKAREGVPFNPRIDTLEGLARVLQKTVDWLRDGRESAPAGSTLGPAVARSGNQPRFAGYVRAGLFETFDPDFQQDHEPIPDYVQIQPGYPRIRQYAYQARGDSMDMEGIHDGMWIVAADAADFIDQNGDLETGDIVVVERTKMQRAEREMTLKELHFFKDRYELRPKSSNPEHQPIVVKHDHEIDADGIEVKIVGILLTAYKDFRRKRSRSR